MQDESQAKHCRAEELGIRLDLELLHAQMNFDNINVNMVNPEEARRCYHAIRTIVRLTRPSELFDQEDREQLADLYEWHFAAFCKALGLHWPS